MYQTNNMALAHSAVFVKMRMIATIMAVTVTVTVAQKEIVSSLRLLTDPGDGVRVGSSSTSELELLFDNSRLTLQHIRIELLTSNSFPDNLMALTEAEVTNIGTSLVTKPSALKFVMEEKEKRGGVVMYFRRGVLDIDQIDVYSNALSATRKLTVRFETMLVPSLGMELVDGKTYTMTTTLSYGVGNANFTTKSMVMFPVRNAGLQGVPKEPFITIDTFGDDFPKGGLIRIGINLYLSYPLASVSVEIMSEPNPQLPVVDLRLIDVGANYKNMLDFVQDLFEAFPCLDGRSAGQSKQFLVGDIHNKGLDVYLEVTKINMAGVVDEAEDAYSSGTPEASTGSNVTDRDLLRFGGTLFIPSDPGDITYAARIRVKINATFIDQIVNFATSSNVSPAPVYVLCVGPGGSTTKALRLDDNTELSFQLIFDSSLPPIKFTKIDRSLKVDGEDGDANGLELIQFDDLDCTPLRINGTYIKNSCSGSSGTIVGTIASVNPEMSQPDEKYRIQVTFTFPDLLYGVIYFFDYTIQSDYFNTDINDPKLLTIEVRKNGHSITRKNEINVKIKPGKDYDGESLETYGTLRLEFPVLSNSTPPSLVYCEARSIAKTRMKAIGGVTIRTDLEKYDFGWFNRTSYTINRLSLLPGSAKSTTFFIRFNVEYKDDLSDWGNKTTFFPVRMTNIRGDQYLGGIHLMKYYYKVKLPHAVIVESITIENVDINTDITFHYSPDGLVNNHVKFNISTPYVPDHRLVVRYYRFSWEICDVMYSKNAKLNISTIADVSVAGDDSGNTLNRFLNVLFNKKCMELPGPGAVPPGFIVTFKYDYLDPQPGPFLLKISGAGLPCNSLQERQIKVSFSEAMCDNDVRFCKLNDVSYDVNTMVTCSYHCNCAGAAQCSFIKVLFLSYLTTNWTLCEVAATQIASVIDPSLQYSSVGQV